MKCKNCGHEIKKFEGKWWHYCLESPYIDGIQQETHLLYKFSFTLDGKECVSPVPEKEVKK